MGLEVAMRVLPCRTVGLSRFTGKALFSWLANELLGLLVLAGLGRITYLPLSYRSWLKGYPKLP